MGHVYAGITLENCFDVALSMVVGLLVTAFLFCPTITPVIAADTAIPIIIDMDMSADTVELFFCQFHAER